MTELTRRNFGLVALAAPLAVGLAGRPALADGHAAALRPALADVSVGSYRVTSIMDGIVPLPKELFFGVDATAVAETLDAAGANGDALPAPINMFLLQSEDRTILVDAGMGGIDSFGPGFGRLTAALGALDVAVSDIDTVIVTHLHPDHVGGLLGPNGPVFAGAEIIIPEVEAGFWGDAGMAAQAPAEAAGLFQLAQGVLGAYGEGVTLAAAGQEVAPGLTLELSPGHTPGHSHVHIDGGDREMLIIADTIHNVTLHTAFPDIGFGFDTDTALAGQSRRALFDRAAADKVLLAGSHVHFPGFGRILADGDGYRYLPATWL